MQLQPELNGRQLTVDVALKEPTIIAAQIGALTDAQLVLGHLFRPFGQPVVGGSLIYHVLSASDQYVATDLEKRAPGAEYKVVEGVLPEPKKADVEDWGGKIVVPNEWRLRNRIQSLSQEIMQLSNKLARKFDERAIEALEAANPDSIAAALPWNQLVTVGDPATLTGSQLLPTASFAEAQELADRDEMGVQLDKLLVGAGGKSALRTAYGRDLAAVLESAELEMVANPRIDDHVAYVVQSGQVGTVAFEVPLTVDVYEDKATKSTIIQVYAVPAFAVDRPYAAKKLTAI